jgi:hypothetical protein
MVEDKNVARIVLIVRKPPSGENLYTLYQLPLGDLWPVS